MGFVELLDGAKVGEVFLSGVLFPGVSANKIKVHVLSATDPYLMGEFRYYGITFCKFMYNKSSKELKILGGI